MKTMIGFYVSTCRRLCACVHACLYVDQAKCTCTTAEIQNKWATFQFASVLLLFKITVALEVL